MLFSLHRFFQRAGEGNSLVYRCRDYTASAFVRRSIKLFTMPYSVCKYFFTWGISNSISKRKGLAFVLTVKNEAPYIKEWLDFHFKQGVSHVIIFDNDSTDNLHEILEPYISSGKVTSYKIHGLHRQTDAYNIATAKYKHKYKYMGFIDADEFVFLRKPLRGGGTIYMNLLMTL